MFREDDAIRRLRGPSPMLPSDIEFLVREVQSIKSELIKIRKALELHGIKVE
ncbi:MAG: hypothetical protein NZ920_06080 [Aigarchaeota archaeon]|nr:hypothetical protein [Aigarchaeota archaeon]MDW8092674.1 hypothetical protein [Nitrososphaerota archaeon]